MKIKKFLLMILGVACALCLALGLTACNGDPEDDTPVDPVDPADPVELSAPELSLAGNVLSWGAVEHADGYEIYEFGVCIDEQSETAYTITVDELGYYDYQVKAVSSDENYTDSQLSNTVTFIVTAKLATPQNVTVSADSVISWDEVENANDYNIYQDGELIVSTYTTSYALSGDPGTYDFTVTATSTNKLYTESDHSAPCRYTLPMTISIGIHFPAGYPEGTVIVGLYDNNQALAYSVEVEVEPDGYGTASFTVPDPEASYMAKVTVGEGYIANTLTVSRSVRQGEIRIIEGSESDLFPLGEQITVSIAGNYGGRVEKGFRATTGGRYTITANAVDGQIKTMSVAVNGNQILDTKQKEKGVFSAQAGDLVIISVIASGEDSGEFAFTITEGAELQHINIGTGYGEQENVIDSSDSYYITVEKASSYNFQFGARTSGVVTLKIDGVSYVFNVDNLYYLTIDLKAGTDIEIEVTLSVPGTYYLFVWDSNP